MASLSNHLEGLNLDQKQELGAIPKSASVGCVPGTGPNAPSTPSSNSPSNTPHPAAPRQSPTPRTPTKKRKLPQLTQHATMTPPTATSTPEPTILRKK